MNKRGSVDLIVLTAGSLLIAAVIIVLFFNIAESQATNQAYYTKFDAYELKYMFHSIFTLSNNAIAASPGDTRPYTIEFAENNLTIYRNGPLNKNKRMLLSIIPTKDGSLTKEFKNVPGPLYFTNIGDAVTTVQPSINTIKCPDLSTRPTSKDLIILEGESTLEKSIAQALIKKSSTGDFTKKLNLINGEGGTVLVINTGSYNDKDMANKNPLKIHIMTDNAFSMTLGCNVAKELMKTYPELTGYSIIPSRDVLPATFSGRADAGLRLVIGNNRLKSATILTNADKLADSINKGLEAGLK